MSAWAVPGYTEERELGRGASGRVVSAIHDASGQRVAIKYLAPRLFRDPAFLAGFREEAALLHSLDVPQVVRLFDYVEDPGVGAAIVMELVEGVSLHQMISSQGATSPESALVVLKGSLLGLASAHQLGIVHRDYKPENVLVDGAGDSKLTDFGVAVKEGKKAPAAGTPLYMAPEQWNGAPATPASDIYAATAVFFECLTGKTPFSGRLGQLAMQHETAAVPVAMVDEPLQALIERGMAKDPRDRPPNAMEFVGELNWVADRAYGPEWEERGRGELARRAAALLLLLLGGAVVGAAGGSYAASALAGITRRKKAVIGGLATGLVVAIAAAGTTLALQGNSSKTVTTTVGSSGPGASDGSGSSGDSSSSGNSPGSSASTTPAPGNSATTTTPGGNPTTTTPAGNPTTTTPAGNPTTATPGGNPTTTNPPTGNPPTTTTGPPPVITISSVSSTPGSPASAGICTDPSSPTFTVSGTIFADQATTVTYQWSSGASATIQVGTQGVTVNDTVTPGSPPWNGSDTLTVTSPVTQSASVNLSTTCTSTQLEVNNPGDLVASAGFALDPPFQMTARGGNGHYSFSWSAGGGPNGQLPPGLTMSSSGVISGTATGDVGQYLVLLTVTDTESTPQTSSTQFVINVESPIL